ncbi:MAG: exodeoxyribonuclease VII large subunit [Planctomycetota bacterium]|nr:exodeoxyribonuclease VII large subunit [Planctomycetota bacterium]
MDHSIDEVHNVEAAIEMARAALDCNVGLIWLEAELFQYKGPHASGHYYFKLRDEVATLDAIMWRGRAARILNFDATDGVKVLVQGRFDIYAARGSLSFQVEAMQPLGVGSLAQQFEELKRKLLAEGMFDAEHKQSLPLRPRKVAVITGNKSAACADVLRSFEDSEVPIQISLRYSLVQGAGAVSDLTQALADVISAKPDVILISRGGGSLEDLWAFNDENLIRQIAACDIPVVSAIGHETDTTLCDFVADVRAITPTAGAQLIAEGWLQTLQQLSELRHRLLAQSPEAAMQKLRNRCFQAEARLVQAPRDILMYYRNKLVRMANSLLHFGPKSQLDSVRSQLRTVEAMLEAANPQNLLERGYALVQAEGQDGYLRSPSAVSKDDKLVLQLADGELMARVE